MKKKMIVRRKVGRKKKERKIPEVSTMTGRWVAKPEAPGNTEEAERNWERTVGNFHRKRYIRSSSICSGVSHLTGEKDTI